MINWGTMITHADFCNRLQFGDLLQKILFPAADGSDDERQKDQ